MGKRRKRKNKKPVAVSKKDVDYAKYLRSAAWKKKRNVILERAQGACEDCGERPAEHIHHITYERLGNELDEDLLAPCIPCHAKRHPGKKELWPDEPTYTCNHCGGENVTVTKDRGWVLLNCNTCGDFRRDFRRKKKAEDTPTDTPKRTKTKKRSKATKVGRWNETFGVTVRHNLAAQVRQRRKAAGHSQAEFSYAVGVTDSILTEIEAGLADIRLSTLINLAAVLNCDVGDLFMLMP